MMIKKLRDSRGMTLVEMLCAVLILSLMGLLISTGLHMAVRSCRDLTVRSETQLLLSTLSSALADDLRYASAVTAGADGELVGYRSSRYGGGEQAAQLTVQDGQVYVNGYRMLAGGAYGGGAYGVPPDGLRVRYEEREGLFLVSLTVRQTGGTISASTEFTVRCLNPGQEEEEEIS